MSKFEWMNDKSDILVQNRKFQFILTIVFLRRTRIHKIRTVSRKENLSEKKALAFGWRVRKSPGDNFDP